MLIDLWLLIRLSVKGLPDWVGDVLTLTVSSVYWLLMVTLMTTIIAAIL